jgi:hypothetical protein
MTQSSTERRGRRRPAPGYPDPLAAFFKAAMGPAAAPGGTLLVPGRDFTPAQTAAAARRFGVLPVARVGVKGGLPVVGVGTAGRSDVRRLLRRWGLPGDRVGDVDVRWSTLMVPPGDEGASSLVVLRVGTRRPPLVAFGLLWPLRWTADWLRIVANRGGFVIEDAEDGRGRAPLQLDTGDLARMLDAHDLVEALVGAARSAGAAP